MESSSPLIVERKDTILSLRLNNIEKRNALNSEMMGITTAALENISDYSEIRAVVISGEGQSFCSGADVKNWNPEELQSMLSAIVNCSVPTIAVVHGFCFGGGMGLICSCDFILASSDSQFGFPEVRIGMVPAIISPYVNRKLDLNRMRELFITGEKFGVEKALGLGILYEAYEGSFSSSLQNLTSSITKGGPRAQYKIKELLNGKILSSTTRDADLTAFIDEIKQSSEGKEGISAFLEKRLPSWSD
ncbi:MAG: enoyl-CoA hydratase-related protein [Candidatus Poseidoniales archaeon]